MKHRRIFQTRFQSEEIQRQAKTLDTPSCDEFNARFIEKSYRSKRQQQQQQRAERARTDASQEFWARQSSHIRTHWSIEHDRLHGIRHIYFVRISKCWFFHPIIGIFQFLISSVKPLTWLYDFHYRGRVKCRPFTIIFNLIYCPFNKTGKEATTVSTHYVQFMTF